MSPDDERHGTTRGYHAGCHDACCKAAMARYEKAGRLARLQGGRAVPALGAQRRIQALMRLGWSCNAIAAEGGFNHRNHILRILRGQKGKPTTWLQKSTDTRVREVYERLSMTIPDGHFAARTRAHAERNGWPPPLAWDNIDDPAEKPAGWQYREQSRFTRAETMRELDHLGEGITGACRRLQVTREGLEKWAERHDMRDVYERMIAREQPRHVANQHMERTA